MLNHERKPVRKNKVEAVGTLCVLFLVFFSCDIVNAAGPFL